MNYSLSEIAAITGGALVNDQGDTVYHVLTDSRQLVQPSGALFVALTGERHDGHRFIQQVNDSGVRLFLVSDRQRLPEGSSGVVVTDTLRALQLLAAAHRRKFNIPVIGITGSNGKTIVKEWLNVMLADDFVIARSPRSYNSQVGVPLSLLSLDTIHTLGIFEAGISQPGEMHTLEEMIHPNIGVLTTIGSAHQEYFESRAHIASEKSKLFAHAEVIICPSDQPEVEALIPAWRAGKRIVSWGRNAGATLRIVRELQTTSETHIDLISESQQWTLTLPFTDRASVENALCASAVLYAMGYSTEAITERVQRAERLTMRTEIVTGVHDCIVVNDSWSADIDSLRIALDVLAHQAQKRALSVVLTDIPQTGLSPEVLYSRVNEMLMAAGVSKLYAVGPRIRDAQTFLRIPAQYFPNAETLIAHFQSDPPEREAILVKGAREFRMERVVQALEEKTHDSFVEINLESLSHNLNAFRSTITPGTKVMVMVKAFGYGSGAKETSALLEFNKVDYLAVAYADEGVALREAGISLPIMVMNPGKQGLSAMIQHRLEPEIFSFRILREWQRALELSGVTEPRPVHIKIDTGMHRLGFDPDETQALLDALDSMPLIKIASLFTHLAAAENASFDEFTQLQISRFQEVAGRFAARRTEPIMHHVLNTGGIERLGEYHMDMVRLGIGLYGVSSSGNLSAALKPVIRLVTSISQKRTIRKGESVGYSRAFIAPEDMTIGVIPIGYADGLRRSLSNGVGQVSINGTLAPIIGKVCMDMTMIDLRGISCEEGDQVEVFGRAISLEQFSQWNNTIPYEILTTMGQRIRRVYIRE
jgi:Alr-MurF fusion protein